MGNFLKFSLLWFLTGSPVAAAILLLLFWLVTDWFTFGFARRILRLALNVRSGFRLERLLAVNPHDRKARFDLGELLVEQRRFGKAIDTLKPLLAEQPDDLPALFAMGQACLGAGAVAQGELFLSTVEQAQPDFRLGTAPLEIGRARLGRGDGKGALEPLRRYLEAHPSSVEGRFLLSRALAATGDRAAAAAERSRAWREYSTSLPYQRRQDRLWAWRARPSRPAMYLALVLAGLVSTGFLVRDVDLGRAAPGVEEAWVDED